MDHPAIGRLRGRGAPAKDWLDRLCALVPGARVHWFPAYGHDSEPSWVIADHSRATVGYRASGAENIRLLEQSARDTGEPIKMHMIYGNELIRDGGHVVAVCSNDAMGTEWLLEDLRESETRMQRHMVQLRREESRQEARKVLETMRHSPQFEQMANDLIDSDPAWKAMAQRFEDEAHDAWPIMMQGRTSVLSAGVPS